MKKNIMMRIASVLLVAVLLSTCAISGTYAKYVTSVSGQDIARVAYWGFTGEDANIAITDLFKTAYEDNRNVNSAGEITFGEDENAYAVADVIAPGTTNYASFTFAYKTNSTATKPEVAYDFTVSVAGSSISEAIKVNPNIVWSLDGGAFDDWETLMTNILRLSGNTSASYTDGSSVSATQRYAPQSLPEAFDQAAEQHTITWKWIFDETANNKENNTTNNDANDTLMGNKDTLDTVKIVIAITATQVD